MRRYFDISHYHAPYKNGVLAGLGFGAEAETPLPVTPWDPFATGTKPGEKSPAIQQLEALLASAQNSEAAAAIRAQLEALRAEEERRIAAAVVQSTANKFTATAKAAAKPALILGGILLVAGGLGAYAYSKRGRAATPNFSINPRRARRRRRR